MKLSRIAGAVKDIASADNPGAKAGAIAAGAATIAHPIIGGLASPAIKKGVETVVNKGIEMSHDPEVQARVKDAGSQAVTRGRSAIAGLASRAKELKVGLG
jgi:hypothetical protein